MKRRAALVAVVVLAAWPAGACPNCIAAQDTDVQWAFLIGSAFLTALPLSLIGGGVLWLWRRAKRLAAEDAAGVVRLPAPPARPRSAV